MTDLTYQLLLELYRGKASVVEQISDENQMTGGRDGQELRQTFNDAHDDCFEKKN